ncbi:TIGR04222 domain-containing membrane protein [Streptomyces sp. 4N509B]|uniref:TIGR04222 domain-containing membrane protein n=1 Tax=Streptomyces sp. 4N509B TaxID=3457413 RepID=UPI003FCF073A
MIDGFDLGAQQYTAIGGLLFGLVLVLREQLRRAVTRALPAVRERAWPGPGTARALDDLGLTPCELAYFSDGPVRAVETALGGMIDRGAVRVSRAGWLTRVEGEPEPTDPVEAAVWRRIGDGPHGEHVRRVTASVGYAPAMSTIRSRLVNRGLLLPDAVVAPLTRWRGSLVTAVVLAFATPPVLLLLAGAPSSDDRLLTAAGVALMLAAGVLGVRAVATGDRTAGQVAVLRGDPRPVPMHARAATGRAALAAKREELTRASTGGALGEVALPVGVSLALLGLVALGDADTEEALAADAPPVEPDPRRDEGGGCGTATAGGDGGGGDGGGGGGCGGGGCGGCGGCGG